MLPNPICTSLAIGTLHSSRLNLVHIADYTMLPAILSMADADNNFVVNGLKDRYHCIAVSERVGAMLPNPAPGEEAYSFHGELYILINTQLGEILLF